MEEYPDMVGKIWGLILTIYPITNAYILPSSKIVKINNKFHEMLKFERDDIELIITVDVSKFADRRAICSSSLTSLDQTISIIWQGDIFDYKFFINIIHILEEYFLIEK